MGRGVRPRADERHAAAEHVEQLRQFVERGLAQDAADGGDAVVVLGGLLHDGAVFADAHRAEFPDADFFAAEAVALLAEEDGAGRGELDRAARTPAARGAAATSAARADGEVEAALQHAVDAADGRFEHADDRQAVDLVPAGVQHLEHEEVGHDVDRWRSCR